MFEQLWIETTAGWRQPGISHQDFVPFLPRIVGRGWCAQHILSSWDHGGRDAQSKPEFFQEVFGCSCW